MEAVSGSGPAQLAARGPAALEQAEARLRSPEGRLIFLLCLSLNLAAAYILAVRLKLFLPGSMASTVQAWLLLTGNLQGFVALGAAQPPLPALLQLPAALLPVIREEGLSAGAVGALAGALVCVLLNRILAAIGLRGRWRYPAVALIAVNPLLIFYSAAGSAEVVALLFVLLSIYLFLLWVRYQTSRPTIALAALISMGFAAGLAPMARYEALPYALLLPGLLAWQARRCNPAQPDRTTAHLITYAAPVAWLLGSRLCADLLVPGDLSTSIGSRPITSAHPLPARLPALDPAAWRYLLVAAPLALLPVALLRRTTRTRPGAATILGLVAILALTVADATSAMALGRWVELGSAPGAPARWEQERQIALYLREQAGTRRVLLDDWDGYRVIFLTGRPKLFLPPGDPGFLPALQEPPGKVGYLLVRAPELRGIGPIEELHPGICGLGRVWSTLEGEWPAVGWRLYRVVAPSVETTGSDALRPGDEVIPAYGAGWLSRGD